MCGIVGLFLKNQALAPELGRLTAKMLITMSERGPDSAGFALYGAGVVSQALRELPASAFKHVRSAGLFADTYSAAVSVQNLILPAGTALITSFQDLPSNLSWSVLHMGTNR